MRVPSYMRFVPAFAFLLPLSLAAQPGDISKPLGIVISLDHPLWQNGVLNYEVVSPTSGAVIAEAVEPDSRYLAFSIPTCNGVNGVWEVVYRPGGARMRINLRANEELLHTQLRLPFVQGEYTIDMPHLQKCIVDQAPEYPVRDFNQADTMACSGGRLVWTRAFHGSTIELPDMMPFTKRAEQAPPSATREASYPGGMINFERFIRTHFSKPLIEQANVRAKLLALVTIETNGSIHAVHLNGSNHPALDREFKRVLQLSSWWQPAVVVNIRNTNDPVSYRVIEQTKVIEFTVDPDSIWRTIPEEQLSILPVLPKAKDSISITLHWIGGSCGQYASEAEVLPQQPDQDFREIVLRFGAKLAPMCEDLQPQRWTHVMPPLPPGRYRLKRADMPGLQGAAWASDPYAVREFEVR